MPIRIVGNRIQSGTTPSLGYEPHYPKLDMPASVLEAQKANQNISSPTANILDTSLALGSVPYNFTKAIIGNPSDPGATTQVSLTNAQKDYLDNIAKSKGTTTGTIDYSDYGSPTKTFSGISGMTPLDASLATTMGGTGYTINPDGSINYTGGEYNFGHGSNNPITNFINTGGIIGAADRFGKNIYDYIHGPQMKFKQQQIMNRRKQDMQRQIREAEAAAAAKAKADAAAKAKADAAAKAKANAAAASQRREGKGGTHMSRSRDQGGLGISQSQAQSISDANRAAGMSGWGLADGGLAQRAPRYANGGLIDFFRYGGFIG
jgi:hypothetical protein